MNLKTKKLIISLGASISAVAPVATVVACGSENEMPRDYNQPHKPYVRTMRQTEVDRSLDNLVTEINHKARDFKGYGVDKFVNGAFYGEKKMFTAGVKLTLDDIFTYSALPVFGTRFPDHTFSRTRGLIPDDNFVRILNLNNKMDFLLDVRNISYLNSGHDTSDYKVAKKPSEFASLLSSLTATTPLENLFGTFLAPYPDPNSLNWTYHPVTYDITQNQDYSDLTKYDNLTTSVTYASDDDANTITAIITLKSDHGSRVITKTIDKVGLSNDDIKYYTAALDIYQLTNDHPELFELTTSRSDITSGDAHMLMLNVMQQAINDGKIIFSGNTHSYKIPVEFYSIYDDIVAQIPFTQIPVLPSGFSLGKMEEFPSTYSSSCTFQITHDGVTIPMSFHINGFKQ